MQLVLFVSCRSPILGNPDPSIIPRQDEMGRNLQV